jgi:hypothetical protein
MVRRIFALSYAFLLLVAFAAFDTHAAWSADLRLPTRPSAQQQDAPDWRKQLFEQFHRWLQRRNQ